MDAIYFNYITAFMLGFLMGRITFQKGYTPRNEESPLQRFGVSKEKKKSITIDNKKFVTDISTDTLEKKGNDLGSKVVSNDDVQSSVVKLSQFKKKK